MKVIVQYIARLFGMNVLKTNSKCPSSKPTTIVRIKKLKMAAVANLNFLNSCIEYARIPFSCTRFGFAVLVWHFVVQLIFLAQMFFGTIKK